MSGEAAFVRAWRVGRYTATLECPQPRPGQTMSAVLTWAPEIPSRLSPAEAQEYRAGRKAALTDMAESLGVRVAVLEL